MSGPKSVLLVRDRRDGGAMQRRLDLLAAELGRRGVRVDLLVGTAAGATETAWSHGETSFADGLLGGFRRALAGAARAVDVVHLAGPRAAMLARAIPTLRRRVLVSEPYEELRAHGFAALLGNLPWATPPVLELVPEVPARSRRRRHGREREHVPHLPVWTSTTAATAPHDVGGTGDASGPDVSRPPTIGLALRPGRIYELRAMLGAFRLVVADHPEARLVLLAARDAFAPAGVAALARGARVHPSAVVVRDPNADSAAAMAGLDVLWSHGAPEPPVRPIVEAFAAGVPVVCDHVTSLAPGIRSIGGALMRDARWPAQFAEATRDVLREPELRAALRRAGPLLVAAEHGVGRATDLLLAAYARATSRSKGRAQIFRVGAVGGTIAD